MMSCTLTYSFQQDCFTKNTPPFFPCHNYLAIRVYYTKDFLYFKSDITFNVQSVDQFTLTSFDAMLADWGLASVAKDKATIERQKENNYIEVHK